MKPVKQGPFVRWFILRAAAARARCKNENKIVEFKLHSSEGEFFAKKQTNSFEESTDLVIQALRKQILKNKKK